MFINNYIQLFYSNLNIFKNTVISKKKQIIVFFFFKVEINKKILVLTKYLLIYIILL